MKILIVGLGSIGRRHARIFRDYLKCDVAALRLKGHGNELGLREIFSWQEAEAWKPDVAVISTPTSMHLDAAMRCARMGAHLFIEKPLSDSLKGLAALKSICARKRLFTYVAYPLRFHPVIARTRQLLKRKEVFHARVVCSSYLPDWRPERNSKDVYSARKTMGGGVILDLSHEFDYLSWLLGDVISISGKTKRVSDITIDTEDLADGVINFKGGVQAAFHLNFMSRSKERWFHIDFKGGFLHGDLIGNSLRIVQNDRERKEELPVAHDDIFCAQAKYFLKSISSGVNMNNIVEASSLLKNILEFRDA